ASQSLIEQGLVLPGLGDNAQAPGGRLFFQTRQLQAVLPDLLPGNTPDNTILNVAIALQKEPDGRPVTLVSKDINLRIKATIVGIHAEDYYNDQVLEDVDLLYNGNWYAPADFWQGHSQDMASWSENGRTYYRIHGPQISTWYPNQCIVAPGDAGEETAFLVRSVGDDGALLERLKDYTQSKNAVWGICARNREQNFALNLLLDPEIDFVTLLGAAGTGKTLLTLAAGLAQSLDSKQYREIIMTRVTVPVGEDIGFLPGTEEEKMTPWMG
ncbi:MAG: PhoH family protein, partial [Candidatus Competibacteraceae bacterium]|nr:PhoH family protein [Candidatus Competibacteraceae bacterium]